MAKSKSNSDYLRLKSFTYWIRNALSELQAMSPEMQKAIEQILTDCGLPQMRDLATLEKTLRKLTLRS
jgi:hypothetical protein